MAEKTVEQRCYEALKARGVTFAAAESCTGGLIAKRITDVPGASLVFMGGVVSYTDTVKHRVLGVPAELLEEYGAVSAPVARAMAEGARKATTADLAVSVTGVAGPDRDERGNAVGTVFIGFSSPEETVAERFDFGEKSRAEIRALSAEEALKLLEEKLKEAYEGVNSNVKVTVQESDSTTGMTSASEGTCDIGMASRDLTDEEKQTLTPTEIALDGIAVIVNPSNGIENLTSDQVKGIFTGEITDWADVQ